MKKAEEYLKQLFEEPFDLTSENSIEYDFYQVIKQAQIDAIEETVKSCAESAKIIHNYYDYDTPELYAKYKHDGFERCDGIS